MALFGKGRWTSASTAVKSWEFGSQVNSQRMLILNEVWEREAGHFSRFWVLDGVRRGILYVKVNSPSAAQELQLRSGGIVKSLNKYFKRSWIKGIKTART